MNYDDKIVALRILDRKHVTLLSTLYNAEPVLTGKLHWETKEPTKRPNIIHMYNRSDGCASQFWVENNKKTIPWNKRNKFSENYYT